MPRRPERQRWSHREPDWPWTWLPFLALLAAAAFARAAIIGGPFVANHEGTACGPLLCVVRNYLRYGPGAAHLGGIMNTGWVAPDNWAIYAHHPPLAPLLIAAFQGVAGVSEWSARAVPSLFSLASAALLYVMAWRRFGSRAAVAAGVLYAFCPLTVTFGGMPEYVGAQLVFFALATVESYVRWTETDRARWLAALALSFALGALTDWPIFYLVPLLAAHHLVTGPRRVLPLGLLVVGAAGLFFGLVLWAQLVSAGRDYWTSAGGDFSFLHQLGVRVLGKPDYDPNPITIGRWVRRVVFQHQGSLHTWPVVLLAALYAAATGWRLAKREPKLLRLHLAPLLLMSWGALHLAVGIQGNFQHAWWSVVLTPGIAFAAALGLETAFTSLPSRLRRPKPAAALGSVAAVLFVASSAVVAHRFSTSGFGDTAGGGAGLKALGTAIRSVASDDEGVLTSEVNAEPALWFYADRQIRPWITSVEQLNRSLGAGPYALYYGYVQPNGPAPRWFVMPDSQRATLGPLVAVLDARFPRHLLDGFSAYQLY